MSKNKKSNSTSQLLGDTAQRVGLIVMSAAMAVSLVELSNEAKRIVLPNQPVLVTAGQNEDGLNQIRREREETAPHFISYSEIQRTPSRSGRG